MSGPDIHDECRYGCEFTDDNPEYARTGMCEACYSGWEDHVYEEAKWGVCDGE